METSELSRIRWPTPHAGGGGQQADKVNGERVDIVAPAYETNAWQSG